MKKLRKVISFILIISGTILLIKEIAAINKNYYLQSAGVICLMLGLFWINSKLPSRFENEGFTEEEEKEL